MGKKYIKLYENVLSAEICEQLIKKFDTSTESESFDDDTKKLDQVTLDMINDPLAIAVGNIAVNLFEYHVYSCGMLPCQIPQDFGLEGIRIKKYYDTSCQFLPHCDVLDHASAKRYLSFLFYLNTIEDGSGRTVFIDGENGMAIQPKQGNCLVFFPTPANPHYAESCNMDKYILSTYINYI